MRKQLLSALLLACSAALVGCDPNKPAPDPTPSAGEVYSSQNARLATAKLGPPLQLDGCVVQAYEVDVTYPGSRPDRYFTLATASCPTAEVKTTRQNCGKNCEHDVLSVTRKDADDEAQAEAKAQVEAKKAALLNKRDQLVKEIEQLNAELEPAK